MLSVPIECASSKYDSANLLVSRIDFECDRTAGSGQVNVVDRSLNSVLPHYSFLCHDINLTAVLRLIKPNLPGRLDHFAQSPTP